MAILLVAGNSSIKNLHKIIEDANIIASIEKVPSKKWEVRNQLVIDKIDGGGFFWVEKITPTIKNFIRYFTQVYYNENLLRKNDDDEYFLIE